MDTIGEEMVITPLGGGQEVGRSCIMLKYQNRTIMLDCGCHPGREGNDSLPFFDALDSTEEVDLILVTHFHIDHCAALPYFTERTDFKGRIFMTHATKAVMKLLLSDNIRLQTKQGLYNEQDLQNCIEKIEVIDFYQTGEHKGIKFIPTPAGHVLGAAMFSIEIDGIRVLYTGDYSMEEDRHLAGADPSRLPPGPPPDVLITESTFGTINMESREVREAKLTQAVEQVLSRGGSCLIPVFALGRAQELLLILETHWARTPALRGIPVLFASRLASRSLKVYQAFVHSMNRSISSQADRFANPFQLTHVSSLAGLDPTQVSQSGPCVVMASPGFLQSGVSRQLLEAWCDDERHGVIIAGYTIEGTMAHSLLSDPKEILCLDNRIKPRRCSVDVVSFGAHVDFHGQKQFIHGVKPRAIILVHGEKKQMRGLKEALDFDLRNGYHDLENGQNDDYPPGHDKNTVFRPMIATPDNGTQVRFRFRKSVAAQVEGSLAVTLLSSVNNDGLVSLPKGTVLVTENFTSKILASSDLEKSTATQLRLGGLTEKLQLPLPLEAVTFLSQLQHMGHDHSHVLGWIRTSLAEVFNDVQTLTSDCLFIQQLVQLQLVYDMTNTTLVAMELQWKAGVAGDYIADTMASLLLQLFSAPSLLLRQQQLQAVNDQQRGKVRSGSIGARSAINDTAAAKQKKRLREGMDDNMDVDGSQLKEVDPFSALPAHVPLPPIASLHALQSLFMDPTVNSKASLFSEVLLTRDNSKLKIRGLPDTFYSRAMDDGESITAVRKDKKRLQGGCLEAFVYVSFALAKDNDDDEEVEGDEAAMKQRHEQHQAVVSCEDEGFRQLVCDVLRQLK